MFMPFSTSLKHLLGGIVPFLFVTLSTWLALRRITDMGCEGVGSG